MVCALRVCPLRPRPGALRGLRRAKPALHDVRHLSALVSPSGCDRKRGAGSCSTIAGSGSGAGPSSNRSPNDLDTILDRLQDKFTQMQEDKAALHKRLDKVSEKQDRQIELLVTANKFGSRLEGAVVVLLVWCLLAQFHLFGL
ncbi:hypothetical protein ABPG77_003076 [Micractinium sp. CCAP 211/92]